MDLGPCWIHTLARTRQRDRAAATGDGCSGPSDDPAAADRRLRPGRDGRSGLNDEDRGDSHDDGDGDYDSDGYGPGEGYYPEGGYEFASALAEASAWEYAEELTRADELPATKGPQKGSGLQLISGEFLINFLVPYAWCMAALITYVLACYHQDYLACRR